MVDPPKGKEAAKKGKKATKFQLVQVKSEKGVGLSRFEFLLGLTDAPKGFVDKILDKIIASEFPDLAAAEAPVRRYKTQIRLGHTLCAWFYSQPDTIKLLNHFGPVSLRPALWQEIQDQGMNVKPPPLTKEIDKMSPDELKKHKEMISKRIYPGILFWKQVIPKLTSWIEAELQTFVDIDKGLDKRAAKNLYLPDAQQKMLEEILYEAVHVAENPKDTEAAEAVIVPGAYENPTLLRCGPSHIILCNADVTQPAWTQLTQPKKYSFYYGDFPFAEHQFRTGYKPMVSRFKRPDPISR